MQSVLLVIHLIIVISLVGLILIQRSEGGGLGIGGGGGGGAGFMSSRGTASLLTRTTAFLAIGFFATSIFLTILGRGFGTGTSIVDDAAGTVVPSAPSAPIGDSGGQGILNQIEQLQGSGSGPQVPAPQQ